MPTALPLPPRLVQNAGEMREAVATLASAPRLALDIESNGLFAYRARVCTVQISANAEVTVVDGLSAPLEALRPLLESTSIVKFVHDVAFDARILAEAGISLAGVRDTSIAARMLGRSATGLASLVQSELGVTLDKKLQHHDWAERPLEPAGLVYLANDVLYLEALADKLWAEVDAAGIALEVEAETRYRLSQAITAAGVPDPRPPWVRLKNIERLPQGDLAILKHLAEVRERLARELDVPPYKVLAPDVLLAIAAAKPRSAAELGKIRGATQGRRARTLMNDVLRAVETGLANPKLTDEERALVDRPRLPAGIAKARRAREHALTRWRKKEAESRKVDPQVVLPGHCLQALADLDEPTIDAVASIPGLGAFRAERYGAAIVLALTAAPAADGAA